MARGLDPGGVERQLADAELLFEAGETNAEVVLDLPPELRNRISRFELPGLRSAGAVSLTDDALQRREVALISGRSGREGLELLTPTHYLEQALIPTADLIDGDLSDILLANPDVIVLADVARLSEVKWRRCSTGSRRAGCCCAFAVRAWPQAMSAAPKKTR